MKSLELSNISAKLSQKLTEWSPLYNKVTKIIDQKTLEMTYTERPVHPKHFWGHSRKNHIIAARQKARILLKYHRSQNIYGNVLAFVRALKQLCDSGLPLTHKGTPVVDLWVLSTAEFDVSDLFDSNVLWLTDPVSGYTIPSLSTYENMDALRALHADVSRNIGLVPPAPDETGEKLKAHRRDAYHGAMPHLWVAAIIEDERIGGGKGRQMVHLDICAAAFGDDGILEYEGSWVSLKIFTTPQFNLVATQNLQRCIKRQVFPRDRFILQPHMLSTDGEWQIPMLNVVPFKVRYLRCFHKMDGSYIEMIPIDTFVAKSDHVLPGNVDAWSSFVTQLRHNIMTEVPVGAKVVICNLQQRPDLNGASGRVYKGLPLKTTRNNKRIYVCVPRTDYPVGLKTTCFLLTTRKQYSCFVEFVQKAEENRLTFSSKEDEGQTISKDMESTFDSTIKEDQNLRLAFEVLTVGKLTILSFANSSFVEGVRKFVSARFNQMLSTSYFLKLRTGLEIADHPQAQEAFKIVTVIKMAKQKVFEKEPSLMRSDGSMLFSENSSFYQLMRKVREDIMGRDALAEIFTMMDGQDFFPFSTWL